MLEKFFEAPEPKQAEPAAANQDMAMTGDDDGEVLTDDLGAAASDEKDNDLDFDNVFNVKTSSDSDKKEENKFSFDMGDGDKKTDENDKEGDKEEAKTESTAAATEGAEEAKTESKEAAQTDESTNSTEAEDPNAARPALLRQDTP